MKYRKLFCLFLFSLATVSVLAQADQDNLMRVEKRIQKMQKLGYEFTDQEGLFDRMVAMYEKRPLLNERGEKEYLIMELTSKNKDPEVAKDLMEFKLPVELAARITREILQMIETELVESNEYWELGGHDYFLEVQLAIDEVALATALNLKEEVVAYRALRQGNKNYEYAIGLVYNRQRMLDLFIFEADNYEILDSIYWLTRKEQNGQ